MTEPSHPESPARTPDTEHRKPAPCLRRIRESDLESLHTLDRICFEPGIAYSRDEIRRFLRLPTARGFVLERGGEVVAFTIGHRPSRRRGSVVTLDVHPDHRRHGDGGALLSRLIADLGSEGVREISLEVDVTNAGAIAFYERFGFRTVARLRGYYGPGRDAFEMALAVASPLP